jgi:hypothetical protein
LETRSGYKSVKGAQFTASFDEPIYVPYDYETHCEANDDAIIPKLQPCSEIPGVQSSGTGLWLFNGGAAICLDEDTSEAVLFSSSFVNLDGYFSLTSNLVPIFFKVANDSLNFQTISISAYSTNGNVKIIAAGTSFEEYNFTRMNLFLPLFRIAFARTLDASQQFIHDDLGAPGYYTNEGITICGSALAAIPSWDGTVVIDVVFETPAEGIAVSLFRTHTKQFQSNSER